MQLIAVKMFVGTVPVEDRSRMNICFVMKEEYKEMEADFIKFAGEKGCVGIKGHRSVGGLELHVITHWKLKVFRYLLMQ